VTASLEEDMHTLAFSVGLVFDEDDRTVFGRLIDAKLLWLDDEECAPIADGVVDELWDDEFRAELEGALDDGAERYPSMRRAIAAARKDLRGYARAVVEQGAVDFAGHELAPPFCLCCVEEGIANAEPGDKRRLAASVARVAARSLSVPVEEIRAAAASCRVAEVLATDERRRAVRMRLRELAELGSTSLPALSQALLEVVDGPLPSVADDVVWEEAVAGLIGNHQPELN
jgi:hypothetical protein